MFFEKIKFRIKLTKILFLFSVFYLTLSPWIIKNYIVHGEFVPTSTRLGYGLWLSNNDFENKIIIKNGVIVEPIIIKNILILVTQLKIFLKDLII